MNAPCKNCPDRKESCHSSCEKYIAYTVELEKMREDRHQNYSLEGCRRYNTPSGMKYKRRHEKRRMSK